MCCMYICVLCAHSALWVAHVCIFVHVFVCIVCMVHVVHCVCLSVHVLVSMWYVVCMHRACCMYVIWVCSVRLSVLKLLLVCGV